jgi:hypothetical protein
MAKNLEWEYECLHLFREVYYADPLEDLEIHTHTLAANLYRVTKSVSSDVSILPRYLELKDFWAWQSNHVNLNDHYTFATADAHQKAFECQVTVNIQQFRPYFSTKKGKSWLGTKVNAEWRCFCSFNSAAPLFVLRFNDMGKAILIGDAFVYGLMDFRTTTDLRRDEENFEII